MSFEIINSMNSAIFSPENLSSNNIFSSLSLISKLLTVVLIGFLT